MTTIGSVYRTVISLLIVGGGGLAVFWLGTPSVSTRPPARGGAQVVRTAIAQEHTDGLHFEVDGVVVPFQQIEIAAQVGGRIDFKSENCRSGRTVKLGELLIRVEQNDYELEVARLDEELKQADAMARELELEIVTTENQIELAKQQLEIDTRQLDRNVRLSTTNAASESELDTARRAELTSRNTLQSLQDNRKLLTQRLVRMESGKALVEANLAKARLSLERTEIYAPLEGIIVSESVEQGGFIQAGNTVITLQDKSQLDVTCKLHMRQMNWLWQSKSPAHNAENDGVEGEGEIVSPLDTNDFPFTEATVAYQLGPVSYQWQGMLNRYDGAGIDNETRMVPCRVHIDNPSAVTAVGVDDTDVPGTRPPALMTGMFVRVQVTAKPPLRFVRIPQEAIQPGNVVWTVSDGKLIRKEARVATSDSRFVVAYAQEDGLGAGDSVVVSPLATPVQGMPVREAGEIREAVKK